VNGVSGVVALLTWRRGLGGLYLIWLGISAWMRRTSIRPPGVVSAACPESLWLYRQGFLTNLLNPKVALIFLAFLPEFIDPTAGYGALSFLLLGGTFMVTGTIWCLIVALGASAFADALRDNPKIQGGSISLQVCFSSGWVPPFSSPTCEKSINEYQSWQSLIRP